MVVEKVRNKPAGLNQRGQSVLEFLLMLPMMIGLVVILVKVNTVIQISIVDQQYARAQTLWLAFNSSVYPTLRIREPNLTGKNYNQMVLGVSENVAPRDGSPYNPKAATHYVARKRGQPEGEARKEPKDRALVRVRNTVTLCTQPNIVNGPNGNVPILKLDKGPEFLPMLPSSLSENSKFDYCASPLIYVHNSDDGEG